ncbi:akirin-related [Anaeramoeba ignava]|uniref:Akirin-related n=1 Tax=Anaeramoeba ignava TaxID=1746090 RepID=A0A9Q0LML4_ANAIG|nr:akirin-related [Anaeramoeba ignava]
MKKKKSQKKKGNFDQDLLRNLPIKERRQHLQKQEKYRKLIPDLEEHLFTSKEVIEIIEKALTKQRRKMTDDFQEYLSFRLSQQFQDFARYNEECIMNSMKQRGEPNYII